MKNIVNKFVVTGLLALSFMGGAIQKSYGGIFSTNSASSNSGTILNGFLSVTEVVIANPHASNIVVRFYDAPDNLPNYAIGAYTNRSFAVGSVTNIYTNIFNVLETNIYTGIITTTSSVPAAAATRRLLNQVTVSSASSLSVTLPMQTTFGLMYTNTGNAPNVGFTINYQKMQ